MSRQIFILAFTFFCLGNATPSVQAVEPGTRVEVQSLSATVVAEEYFPGVFIYRIDVSTTCSFAIDANENMGNFGTANSVMSVHIKDSNGNVIASDTGSGTMMSAGESRTQTVNLFSYASTGTYTVSVQASITGELFLEQDFDDTAVTVP
ncbi:MAG: hypothetical protein R3C59_03495 [Planctomycetaceae bacterium]